MCKKLAEWILKNVKVSRDDVAKALDVCDEDKDGFYSLGEIVKAIIWIVKNK